MAEQRAGQLRKQDFLFPDAAAPSVSALEALRIHRIVLKSPKGLLEQLEVTPEPSPSRTS